MGWSWGWPIRWCLAMGGPEFCQFCVVVTRAWHHLILRRSTVFTHYVPPPDHND